LFIVLFSPANWPTDQLVNFGLFVVLVVFRVLGLWPSDQLVN